MITEYNKLPSVPKMIGIGLGILIPLLIADVMYMVYSQTCPLWLLRYL